MKLLLFLSLICVSLCHKTLEYEYEEFKAMIEPSSDWYKTCTGWGVLELCSTIFGSRIPEEIAMDIDIGYIGMAAEYDIDYEDQSVSGRCRLNGEPGTVDNSTYKAIFRPAFKKICERYNDLPYLKRDITVSTVNGQKVEIISFYNSYFLKEMGIEKYILENSASFLYKLGETSPVPNSRYLLDRMKLESPLHRTIPETIAQNSNLIMKKMQMKSYSHRRKGLKESLGADESPLNFLPAAQKKLLGPKGKRALPSFHSIEDTSKVKKRLKIGSNILTNESFANLDKLKKKVKDFKVLMPS